MSEINENVIIEEPVEGLVDTHEYVNTGKESFQTESIMTGSNSISFALADMPIVEVVGKFSNLTELEVSGADLQPYGIYKNLAFASATVDTDGIVTVTFRIASDEEIRLANLEQTQAEQDEVIAELIGGGEL